MRNDNELKVRGVVAMSGLIVALALAGCLSVPIPQAEADPTRFYVLATSASPASPPAAAEAPTIHVQPVEIASYLRSRPLIVRRGEHEIEFREFARWGESLELGVARVLREELLARGAGHVTVGAGGLRMGAPTGKDGLDLSVRVLACEGAADGSVLFRAIWELRPRDGAGAGSTAGEARPVRRGDFRAMNLRWDGESEAELAARLSEAVGALAAEIVAAAKN